MGRSKIDRTGITNTSKDGYLMKIVKYENSSEIYAMFLKHGCIVKTQYYSFKNGNVNNPFHPTICNIGFMGEGKHVSKKKWKRY